MPQAVNLESGGRDANDDEGVTPELLPVSVRPDEVRSALGPAVLSFASGVAWWLCLLVAYLKGFDDPGFLSGIGLYFLPLAAIMLAMKAIDRSRSVPKAGRDRRWKLARVPGYSAWCWAASDRWS